MKQLARIITLFVLGIGVADGAASLSFDEMSEAQQKQYMSQFTMLEVTGKAVPWTVFQGTKEKETRIDYPDGSYAFEVTPEYGKAIAKLDDQVVELMGYMFPLEAAETQQNFLFGPYPMSCPFHYHTTPSMVVEVNTQEPIPFSYEPFRLRGTLKLDFNKETVVFYYLHNATVVDD